MHVKKLMKTPIMVGFAVVYLGATLFFQSVPVTYAWFTSSSISKGYIQNATTSELINMIPSVIEYLENSRIKSQISITNISAVSIPLRIELLSNNEVIQSFTTILKQKGTYSTNLEELEALTDKDDLKNLQYRIVGFEGYIDEIISVQMDEEKVKSVIKKETEEIKEEIKVKEDKQESSESDQQIEKVVEPVAENPVEKGEIKPPDVTSSENDGNKDISPAPGKTETTPITESNDIPLKDEKVN